MRQSHFKLFALALVVLTLSACNGKAKKIAVSEDKLAFAIVGGEKTVKVTADGSFEVSDCPEWLTVETADSTVTVKAGENKTGAVRKCEFHLVGADGVSVPISVTQQSTCTHITITPNEVSFTKDGGSDTLTIDTDGAPLSLETTADIKAEFKDSKLIISTPANDRGPINGSVTITCDTVTTVVKVTVAGTICPTCKGSGKVRCTQCRGIGYIDNEMYRTQYGCTGCGGQGERVIHTFSEIPGENPPPPTSYGFVKGTGKMFCPVCGGLGF